MKTKVINFVSPSWDKTSFFQGVGGGEEQIRVFPKYTVQSHSLTAPNFRKSLRLNSENKMCMLLDPNWGKNSPICDQSELLQDFDKSCYHDAITYMYLQYTIVLQNLRKPIRDFKNNVNMILDPSFGTFSPFWVQ